MHTHYTLYTTFTCQGVVIWYHYTIPWQKWISESRAWRCSWRKSVIVCQPIRTISVNIQFSLFIYAMRDCLWLVPYDACGTNQIEAQLLVATFVKGLCRGTISQYLDLWRWLYTRKYMYSIYSEISCTSSFRIVFNFNRLIYIFLYEFIILNNYSEINKCKTELLMCHWLYGWLFNRFLIWFLFTFLQPFSLLLLIRLEAPSPPMTVSQGRVQPSGGPTQARPWLGRPSAAFTWPCGRFWSS